MATSLCSGRDLRVEEREHPVLRRLRRRDEPAEPVERRPEILVRPTVEPPPLPALLVPVPLPLGLHLTDDVLVDLWERLPSLVGLVPVEVDDVPLAGGPRQVPAVQGQPEHRLGALSGAEPERLGLVGRDDKTPPGQHHPETGEPFVGLQRLRRCDVGAHREVGVDPSHGLGQLDVRDPARRRRLRHDRRHAPGVGVERAGPDPHRHRHPHVGPVVHPRVVRDGVRERQRVVGRAEVALDDPAVERLRDRVRRDEPEPPRPPRPPRPRPPGPTSTSRGRPSPARRGTPPRAGRGTAAPATPASAPPSPRTAGSPRRTRPRATPPGPRPRPGARRGARPGRTPSGSAPGAAGRPRASSSATGGTRSTARGRPPPPPARPRSTPSIWCGVTATPSSSSVSVCPSRRSAARTSPSSALSPANVT